MSISISTSACIPALPQELQPFPQWVAWKYEPDPDRPKPKKVPICHRTGANAKTTERATWGTYIQALDRKQRDNLDGIGFVLTAEDPFVGIDLDHCRNPATGEIAPEIMRYVDWLNSYTEVSPSGTGLRIFVMAKLPPGGRKKGPIEMYDTARYLTVTGQHLDGTPLEVAPRQAEVAAIHAEVWPSREPRPEQPATDSPRMDDMELLARALKARNGQKFSRLFDGDTTGYASHSEADMALCSILAFWTQDEEQIDRLFRQSGLYRDKWDENRGSPTYGERTIAEAIHTTPSTWANSTYWEGAQNNPPWPGGVPRTFETEVQCAKALGLGEKTEGLTPCSQSDPFTCPFSKCGCLGEVTLYRAASGDLLLFHGDDRYTLAELRTGRKFRKKNQTDHMTWRLRLLAEAGLLELPEVFSGKLPTDASEASQIVYNGFLERLAINEVSFPGQPIMFSWRFCAAWCGISEAVAKRGMKYLLCHHLLAETGKARCAIGKATALYRPFLSPWEPIDMVQIEADLALFEQELAEALATGSIEELVGAGGIA